MPSILDFCNPLATQPAESGGKGANLARLTQAGFPVPSGFIVRAQVFRDFVSGVPDLFQHLNQFPTGDPTQLASQAASLRTELAVLPLPSYIYPEIRAALAEFPPEQAFSVRSSSTLEDLALAAFAGQHETFLNCIGEDRILAAINACFLSLFADRAIAYRAQMKFPHEQAAMAVVVQQMVPCEVAGVAFTINPISGDLGEILVNSNFGLGESVVNGDSPIDQFALDKSTKTLRSQQIATKTHKIVPAAHREPMTQTCHPERSNPASSSAPLLGAPGRAVEGPLFDQPNSLAPSSSGVTQIPLSSSESSTPSLTPNLLTDIADLALRVEDHYHFPQDIEWGIANDQLFLLQSRPITTIPPRWTRDESAERFPTAITPLTWDFVEDGFHRSLAYSLRLMGFPPFQGKWFTMFDHYIYGNQNAVDLYLKRIPLRLESIQQLEAAIPVLRQNYRWVQELPLLWSRDLDYYLIRIGEFMAQPLDSQPLPALWAYVKEVRELGAHYFQPNIAISITQALLHRVLFQLLVLTVGPADAPRLLDSLLAFCEAKTGMINAELYALADQVRRTPALLQMFREHSSREIIEQKLIPPFREFSTQFDTFLRIHGHREVEFDAYHPTWLEVPWVVLDHIRLLLGTLECGGLFALSALREGPPLSRSQSQNSTPISSTQSSPSELPNDPVHDAGAPPSVSEGGSSLSSRSPEPDGTTSVVPENGPSTSHDSPASSHPLLSPAQREHELRLRMHKAELELFSRLPSSLHFFFHEIIRLARAYTSLDDLEHYQTTRLTLPLRKGLREIGRRLYIRGVLADPMDIFFAHAAALEHAIPANDDKQWRAFADSIRTEKATYLLHSAETPPWTAAPSVSAALLSTTPVAADLQVGAVAQGETVRRSFSEGQSASPAPSCAGRSLDRQPGAPPSVLEGGSSGSPSTSHQSLATSHCLTGLAGSPGQATGPVFLVRSMEDFAVFPKGAVLVARTTNPTWTPLFYNAVAVVTESGGPLSHGAVTAREMQIPAVMSVRDCMSALKNGDIVQVDGSHGQVTLLKR
jgi:phosphohistidine swiveling domain-containing protein